MTNYPKNKEEWWGNVEKHWEDLKYIVLSYYPNQKNFPKKGWPLRGDGLLASPQSACNAVIKELRAKDPIWLDEGCFEDYLKQLKETKDVELDKIFQSSWFGMPESPSVREVPGFFVFCDLCSESSVLYEQGE